MRAGAEHGRQLTDGEVAMLRALFGEHIAYERVRVYGRKWRFFQPRHIAMAPNGHVYFPPLHYREDFSLPSLPLRTRAWFVHEGAHLYQHYGLNWNLILRGPFQRRYSYRLVEGRPFARYGLEQMGTMAADYYVLSQGGRIERPYQLSDYAGLLPILDAPREALEERR